MNISQDKLGNRIRTARKSAGYTQQEVADHLEMSRSRVAKIEQGESDISSVQLEKLAYYLGRSLQEFFADEFKPERPLEVLFRKNPDLTEHSDVRASLRHCMRLGRELSSLEDHLGIERDLHLTPDRTRKRPDTRWEAIEQGTRLAKEERNRLDLGENPISDLPELLENHGVRTVPLDLPEDVSGLTIISDDTGMFIVVNRRDIEERVRFSYAHEYCHVLLDMQEHVTVSRRSQRKERVEVRANAFAAEFLMPESGVLEYVSRLGKELEPRRKVEVSDEDGSVHAENRPEPGSRDIQLYDVVQLANYYGVSYTTALYRLKNIRDLRMTEEQFETFKENIDTHGKRLEELLNVPEHDNRQTSARDFKQRFLGLALEAYRREKISFGKLAELGKLVDVSRTEIQELVHELGFDHDIEQEVLTGDG